MLTETGSIHSNRFVRRRQIPITREMLTKEVMGRFFKKVIKSEGCWLWTGSRDNHGYGRFLLHGKNSSPVKASRISWVFRHGEIKRGNEMCHRCDNPPCINPDHMFSGTHFENMTDAKMKGRMKCPSKGKIGELNNSAKLTAEKVLKIRKLWACGHSMTKLGKKFKVTRHCISFVCRRIKWKHI